MDPKTGVSKKRLAKKEENAVVSMLMLMRMPIPMPMPMPDASARRRYERKKCRGTDNMLRYRQQSTISNTAMARVEDISLPAAAPVSSDLNPPV